MNLDEYLQIKSPRLDDKHVLVWIKRHVDMQKVENINELKIQKEVESLNLYYSWINRKYDINDMELQIYKSYHKLYAYESNLSCMCIKDNDSYQCTSINEDKFLQEISQFENKKVYDKNIEDQVKKIIYNDPINAIKQLNEFDFEFYRVIDNHKSQPYYEVCKDDIYVIYNKEMGWYCINSTLLSLELSLYIGLDEKDIELRTNRYKDYIANLKLYIKLLSKIVLR